MSNQKRSSILFKTMYTAKRHNDSRRRTAMRKVAAGLFISLDGVTEAPNQWQFDSVDEDLMMEMGSYISQQDTVLLGRVTYQDWEPYWPTSNDEPFASFINNTPKVVVSTTLDKVTWGKFANATLVKSNVAEEITKLKEQPGKTIGISGSPTLVRSLLQHDLLDELTLLVHPVVVGKGKRLFKDGSELKRLKLVDSKTT
jgi:dihydrofolate reductase